MSLLVPDYTSSSEDEEPLAPVPTAAPLSSPSCGLKAATNLSSNAVAPAKDKPQTKKSKIKMSSKPKTRFYLPPVIQRLLETGKSEDSSEEDGEWLGVHAKAVKKGENKRVRPDQDSGLSFLPKPKHQLPLVVEHVAPSIEAVVVEKQEVPEDQTGQQAGVDEAAAWQQYYQQQEHYHGNCSAPSQEYYVAQREDDVLGGSSKRRRTRERDIERALEEGHFETVSGQIADVHGPMPTAWQPPVDPLTGARGPSDQEVRVNASFWNAQAGTKVSSIKPSRLQRQKHQLNQLAFDAKARDFELLDKRGASLKTKRETYAKYGW